MRIPHHRNALAYTQPFALASFDAPLYTLASAASATGLKNKTKAKRKKKKRLGKHNLFKNQYFTFKFLAQVLGSGAPYEAGETHTTMHSVGALVTDIVLEAKKLNDYGTQHFTLFLRSQMPDKNCR